VTRRPALLALVVLTGLATHGHAQINSGPADGAKVEPFPAYAATGGHAGQSVDFVAARKDAPTIYVFVRADQWSRPMARYLRALDQEIVKGVDRAEGLAAVAVWLTEDPAQSKQYLPVAQQSLNFERTTLAVFEGDRSGPAGWSVNGEAFLTAVVVRDGKVVKSFGYLSLNETDVPDVVRALKTP
jgi:hypothetical protein